MVNIWFVTESITGPAISVHQVSDAIVRN